MAMPGRKYEPVSGYRYGFNGKEKDKDMNSLTAYDYGFRIYNPALGKFLSVDPLTTKYPYYTPYQFAGNKPINSIDLDGLEEYSSYEAYKQHKGDKALSTMDGSDGAWLVSDRKNKTETWSNAMEAITKNNWTDKFTTFQGEWTSSMGDEFGVGAGDNPSYRLRESYSFGVVRDYYNWAQHQIDERGMSSEWAKGASYLVNGFVGNDFGMQMSGTYNLMKDLNLAIAQYSVSKFNSKLYGSAKDGYDFDFDFIVEEQGSIAQPVYEKYAGTNALKTANSLARKEGSLYWWIGGMIPYLPSFADFGVDITVSNSTGPNSNFGRGGRQHIPMLMLYSAKHAEYLKTSQQYICTGTQLSQVELANAFIQIYYETKMKY